MAKASTHDRMHIDGRNIPNDVIAPNVVDGEIFYSEDCPADAHNPVDGVPQHTICGIDSPPINDAHSTSCKKSFSNEITLPHSAGINMTGTEMESSSNSAARNSELGPAIDTSSYGLFSLNSLNSRFLPEINSSGCHIHNSLNSGFPSKINASRCPIHNPGIVPAHRHGTLDGGNSRTSKMPASSSRMKNLVNGPFLGNRPPSSRITKRPVNLETQKLFRRHPGPRNIQTETPLSKLLESEDSGICPVCNYQIPSNRLPDYRRHLRTHRRPPMSDQTQGWWCQGVLIEVRDLHGVPPSMRPYHFGGKQRVGGCLQSFARRDALVRHLRAREGRCFGQASYANGCS